jgi:hypothetical protein
VPMIGVANPTSSLEARWTPTWTPLPPHCMSSLKERGRSISAGRWLGGCAAPSVQAGSRQPADGSTVERPKRSEDERPWGCQGLTQGGSGGVTVAWSMASLRQGVEADGSSIASNRWPWAARSSGAGHPFAVPRRHGAVRPQPSGLNQVGRPRRRAGGHDTHEHAPGCARAVHIAFPGAGARQRTWPSCRP